MALDAAQPQPQQEAGSYSQIASALKSVAGSQQKQQAKGGGMQLGSYRPRPISLQQARAMFDPGRFYTTLRNAGVRGV